MENTVTIILPELSMFLNTLQYQMGNSQSALLPCLHAAQEFSGYISEQAILEISQNLDIPVEEIDKVVDFYTLFHRKPVNTIIYHMCNDPVCKMAGFNSVNKTLRSFAAPSLTTDSMKIEKSPCLGLCSHSPYVTVQNGLLRIPVKNNAASRISISTNHSRTEIMGNTRLLTRNCGKTRTCLLMEYWSKEGYQALKKALNTPKQTILDEIKASSLTGRGGDSFLTGIKWEKAFSSSHKTRYVICNAAEADPTSFKDRVLMEDNPHGLLEGMIITGYVLGAEKGYIYINGEYDFAESVLSNAIMDAREAGLLGSNIMGSKYSFDIEIRRGAGRYISGEETALLESIEGKCAIPRGKPPFPTSHGLFGKPTIINNVETYSYIPLILQMGAMEFRKIGTDTSKGTVLISVTGDVECPGLVEIPYGQTFRDVIFGFCKGMSHGLDFKTALVGGVSGKFIIEKDLDIPISLDGLNQRGLSLGPGSIVVLNESRRIKKVLSQISGFLASECCGQCPCCVVGTFTAWKMFEMQEKCIISKNEMKTLNDLQEQLEDKSVCRMGKTALNAIHSALVQFPSLIN